MWWAAHFRLVLDRRRGEVEILLVVDLARSARVHRRYHVCHLICGHLLPQPPDDALEVAGQHVSLALWIEDFEGVGEQLHVGRRQVILSPFAPRTAADGERGCHGRAWWCTAMRLALRQPLPDHGLLVHGCYECCRPLPAHALILLQVSVGVLDGHLGDARADNP